MKDKWEISDDTAILNAGPYKAIVVKFKNSCTASITCYEHFIEKIYAQSMEEAMDGAYRWICGEVSDTQDSLDDKTKNRICDQQVKELLSEAESILPALESLHSKIREVVYSVEELTPESASLKDTENVLFHCTLNLKTAIRSLNGILRDRDKELPEQLTKK